MSQEIGQITRRRFLGGLATVGGASTAAGAGTAAFFNDVERSSGNTIQAGTINLQLNGQEQTVTLLNAEGIVPGDSDSSSIYLDNTGSLTGALEIEVTSVDDSENGIMNKESNEGDTTSDDGELEHYIEIRIYLDGEMLRDWTGLDTIQQTVQQNGSVTYDTGRTLSGGESKPFTVEWQMLDPGNSSVNEVQTDSVEVDLTFRLVQP